MEGDWEVQTDFGITLVVYCYGCVAFSRSSREDCGELRMLIRQQQVCVVYKWS